MLTRLNIQGLAIIDSLEIEFSHGFNVITGETGAGKSILIKALGLLLGTKASVETVRRGRESATVAGLFEAPPEHRCMAVLERYGIPIIQGSGRFEILVRRLVSSKGRSQAWINDCPVTITVLKDLANSLIDVFGQHDNTRLLDPGQHTRYLDQFLKKKTLLTEYRQSYDLAQDRLKHLVKTVDDYRIKQRDADYLSFRCEELRRFDPSLEDFEKVQDLCLKSRTTLDVAETLEKVQGAIDQGAGGRSLSGPLWEAARHLRRLAGTISTMEAAADEAEDLATRLDELSFTIGRDTAGLDLDEHELEDAQERLAGYQTLFRKMAVSSIEELLREQDRLEQDLSSLESAADEVTQQLSVLAETVAKLKAAGQLLSKARRGARALVTKDIEAELHELAMPGASLAVDLVEQRRSLTPIDLSIFGSEAQDLVTKLLEELNQFGELGREKALFLLASNPGEVALPLNKVASGGEVSRIMLALKRALAAGADTCILVFDEIDTGISGRIADVVGRKMRELSQNFQVICISHLPQVAAHANSHFLVHKEAKGSRTESTISHLSRSDSEQELARLLSGDKVTGSSLANARQLKKKANQPTA